MIYRRLKGILIVFHFISVVAFVRVRLHKFGSHFNRHLRNEFFAGGSDSFFFRRLTAPHVGPIERIK